MLVSGQQAGNNVSERGPKARTRKLMLQAAIQLMQSGITPSVTEVAEARRAGRLAVKPSEPEKCTRTGCDGYDLCRVARARFLVKAGRPGWQKD